MLMGQKSMGHYQTQQSTQQAQAVPKQWTTPVSQGNESLGKVWNNPAQLLLM